MVDFPHRDTPTVDAFGVHYIASFRGRWFGIGMELDHQGAAEIVEAMRMAHLAGVGDAKKAVRAALGLEKDHG